MHRSSAAALVVLLFAATPTVWGAIPQSQRDALIACYEATDGDNYLVDHSAAVLVIDPGGRFSGLFSGPHSVQNFVHDLPIIINGK